jgi:uncharacterized protein (TIGR02145 family)
LQKKLELNIYNHFPLSGFLKNINSSLQMFNLAFGYCGYNNDPTTYKAIYGALYNWNTVQTGNLCPSGWHVPTDSEWNTLITYWGGENVAGGKLKETGITHWEKPNAGATNEGGLTALPGSYLNNHGTFANIGFFGFWWAATENVPTASWCRTMGCTGSNILRIFSLKKNGYFVRCIKD